MAALELKHIKGNTYYIPSPACIGVYEDKGKAYLIDSGNDKEAGRQILKLIEGQGWKLEMIINTHSNADHCGGNAFLQQKTGCRIAASRLEAAFISNPVLEPAFLFGGFPHRKIKSKFLMSSPSDVTDILNGQEISAVPGSRLETFPLPGHFFEMTGVRTPDNTVFIADTLFSEHILNKYHVFYLFDVKAHLETLDYLETLEAEFYVPSHAGLHKDISSLIKINRNKIEEISLVITELCGKSMQIDDILEGLCRTYSIMLDDSQYVLVLSALKAYLVYLLEKEIITAKYTGGRLFWTKSPQQ